MKSSPLRALSVSVSVPTLLLACALLAAAPPLAAQLLPSLAPNAAPDYPLTRQVEHVDTYHGQRVADPYRWLEDDRSAETAAWVAAQNRVTDTYFERIGFRADLQTRLTQLFDHPRCTVPERRGNQLLLPRQHRPAEPERGLAPGRAWTARPSSCSTPTRWPPTAPRGWASSSLQPSGRHAAYALSQAGSDWQELRVLDLATRTPLPERLQWVKVSGIAWAGDGFFYSRYPAPAAGTELSAPQRRPPVYFHRIGTPQSRRRTGLRRPGAAAALPHRGHHRRRALCGAHRLRTRQRPARQRAVRARPAQRGQDLPPARARHRRRQLQPWSSSTPAACCVRTDDGAPNGRIIAVDPARPGREHWQTVVAERADEPLRGASLAGGRLFVLTLKDVTSRAYVHMPDGRLEREIALPGLGTASGFGGRGDDTGIFYTYTSFDTPPIIFRYDVASGQSSVFRRSRGFRASTPADYVTRQVFFTSRDGTRVPMFLVHRKGLAARRPEPDAAVRLRRLQRQPAAGLQRAAAGAAGAGRRATRWPTCAAAPSTAAPGTRPAPS